MTESIPFRIGHWRGPSDVQVAEAKNILAERDRADKEAKSETLIQCTTQVATGKGCKAWYAIKDLVYIQTHWYTKPHGCTGGDYWNEGEGQWICPACGHRNRLYKTPEVEQMKSLFASVEKIHNK